MKSFLQLPPEVRLRVYHAAGLVTGELICLDRDERAQVRAQGYPSHGLPLTALPDLATSMNLLQLCRATHAEVSAQFFSTNHFFTGNLWPLCQLSDISLASLKSLSLYLHIAWPEKDDWQDPVYARPAYEYLYTASLENSSVEDNALLADWEEVAKLIGPLLRPNSLNLRFACDVADADTARLAVAPFRHLPVLSGTEIRLGCNPNSELALMAKKTGLAAMGRRARPQSAYFPFMGLPWELRHKILTYTDLVTPLNCVQLSSNRQYRIPDMTCKSSWDYPRNCKPSDDNCHPYSHLRCDWKGKCQICPHPRGWEAREEDIKTMCCKCQHYACQFLCCGLNESSTRDTFCTRLHASFSPPCRCWKPPTSLFLVSREFSELSKYVFFSLNHLDVNHDLDKYDISLRRVALFSQAVPRTSLRYLRSLDFDLDDLESNLEEWKILLKHIDSELKLERLCLRAYLSEDLLGYPIGPIEPSHLYHPPKSVFEGPNGIDTVKEVVALMWDAETLTAEGSIMMFLAEMVVPNATWWYYFRHKEHFPPPDNFSVGYMAPEEVHNVREIKRKDDAGHILGTGSEHPADWIEGIFIQPHPGYFQKVEN